MKLTWKDIDGFVKKPDPAARVILVYGPDDGLVRERAAMMAKTVTPDLNDPFNVCALPAETISDDAARLSDEANAMSMMGGARLIRITEAGDKLSVLIKDYLSNPSVENLVILEAGELGKNSSLRKLCEGAKNAAAVPCYVDDEKGVGTLIRQTLTANGFSIQNDAATWLSMNIAGDRLRVRGEIEKLMVYMGKDKTITLDHVQGAVGEAGDQSLDDLIYAIGEGKPDTALRAYNKLIGEGVAVVTILRVMQNHFKRLHFTKSLMDEGADLEFAMKKLQPEVFFKYKNSFTAQTRKFSSKKLLAVMSRLAQVEAQTKQTGTPVETLCSQAILSLSAQ